MPDITMCAQDECALMGKCYRHEAKPNPYGQSFAIFAPETELSCSFFISMDAAVPQQKET